MWLPSKGKDSGSVQLNRKSSTAAAGFHTLWRMHNKEGNSKAMLCPIVVIDSALQSSF